MKKEKIVMRIEELENKIIYHKSLYYQGRPEISDADYDRLEEELKAIDPLNPILSLVGHCHNESASTKVKHNEKMLSLDKVYDIDQLMDWTKGNDVVSTLKVDGVSCSIIYKNGKLDLAKTRGDGVFGENITDKVLWVKEIPKSIKIQSDIEIRGELYLSEENFFQLSNEMVQRNLEKPSNPRNIVAGLMGRKENIDLCRHIQFFAFDLIPNRYQERGEEWVEVKREIEKEKILQKNLFQCPKIELHKFQKDSLEQYKKSLLQEVEFAKEFMSEGDYQIDGLVLTYDRIELQNELGATAHHPRYKMAFKFVGEAKQTQIKSIQWQVSRNGILTPVAEVEPTLLSGAMISKVTLHNYGIVKQHNLKVGDEIEVIRSGEVIPKFLRVIKESHQTFQIPTECPSCHSPLTIETIRLNCTNEDCGDRKREQILNFVSKIGIYDLSSKRLQELMDKELVQKISDLYRLSPTDFLKLDKFKDTLAEKLFQNIQKSKKTQLAIFLSSLGIAGGALNKCEKVVFQGYDTIEKILTLKKSDIEAIDGFAEKSAEDFFMSLQKKIPLITELIELGFEFEKKEKIESLITGKKICITGALSEKRSVIENTIRDNGGVVLSSVTKHTDYLLTNETDPSSSKFKKAIELKITIISEQEFFQMIK